MLAPGEMGARRRDAERDFVDEIIVRERDVFVVVDWRDFRGVLLCERHSRSLKAADLGRCYLS